MQNKKKSCKNNITGCHTIGIHIHNDIDKKKLLELVETPSGKRNESEASEREIKLLCVRSLYR